MTSQLLAHALLFYLHLHWICTVMSQDHRIHPCRVESYEETIQIRDCSNSSIVIQTARCRGQCYSEDLLIYDWQYPPKHYRHQHRLDCCSPNRTSTHTTQMMCHNRQLRTIHYQIVIDCDCKSCSDKCVE
jgi:hypothetical protein